MVEGPGATRNGRKVQSAVGCLVASAEFGASSSWRTTTVGNATGSSIVGRRLAEAFTVGKELFLIFSAADGSEAGATDGGIHGAVEGKELALRLHFGMNGCLYVGKSPQIPPWRRNEEASLRIEFLRNPLASTTAARESQRLVDDFFLSMVPPTSQVDAQTSKRKTVAFVKDIGSSKRMKPSESHVIVEARGTSVTGPVSAKVARAKLARLACQDSCSPSFDARRVFDAIRGADPSMLVCDAVLNQDIFPGVGNIIKVEGLHRAKVDPRRHVSALSDDEVRRIVLHCRRYSMGWLDTGRAPQKHVYDRTICGTCQTASVSMQKMGGGPAKANGSNHAYMSRVTFWCSQCQHHAQKIGISNCVSGKETKGPTLPPLDTRCPYPLIKCPQHGTCILRRVRKLDSQNAARLFRSCRAKQCQFFAWADGHLPSCSCRKKTILRVSKTERSGGRWFLSCASNSQRKSGCGFFEWAKPEHLVPFGSALTPLL